MTARRSSHGRAALLGTIFLVGVVIIAAVGALYGPPGGRTPMLGVAVLALLGIIGVVARSSARHHARQRLSEDAVRESEARKAAIMSSALDAIVSLDADGAILELNRAAERMFGRRAKDVVGRPLVDVIMSAEDRSRGREQIARHFARSESSVLGGRIQLTAVRADGSEFPAEVSVARVNRADAPTYTSFIRDLSDAARTRAELVRSNERLRVVAQATATFAQVTTTSEALLGQVARTIADLVGDACLISLITDDGTHLSVVASAHRDAVRERDYAIYLADLDLPLDGSSVAAQVAQSGRPMRAEITPAQLAAEASPALRPLVERLAIHAYAVVPIRVRQRVLGTLSALRGAPGKPYSPEDVTMLEDLAERAGLAIENARLYEQLEERVRERTKDMELANRELEAFSYSVAHDLRAPLRGIAGFSQAVLEDYAGQLDATGVEHLRRIDASARRMGELIDDLLQLAKVSRAEVRRRRVDLSERARAAIGELRATHPAREVEVEIASGLLVEADRGLLDVVLSNLLGNAWKFTGRTAHARIEVGANLDATPPIYFVRDNGAGFDAAYSGKLFGVFERLHAPDEFDGTGIGLAIVQRIVDRHGGRVWAEGKVGAGATLYFTLEPPHTTRSGRSSNPPTLRGQQHTPNTIDIPGGSGRGS